MLNLNILYIALDIRAMHEQCTSNVQTCSKTLRKQWPHIERKWTWDWTIV